MSAHPCKRRPVKRTLEVRTEIATSSQPRRKRMKKIPPPPPSPLGFFDLPNDLRNHIYQQIIDSHALHTLKLDMYIDDVPIAIDINKHFHWVPSLKFLPGFAYANGRLFVEFMSLFITQTKLIVSHPYHVQNIGEILDVLPRKHGIDQIREVHFTHFDTIGGLERNSYPLRIFSSGARLTKLKIDFKWDVGNGSWSTSGGEKTFTRYDKTSGADFGSYYDLTEVFKMKALSELDIVIGPLNKSDIEAVGATKAGRVNDAWASLHSWISGEFIKRHGRTRVVADFTGSVMRYRIVRG